jgi:hypothetical protein
LPSSRKKLPRPLLPSPHPRLPPTSASAVSAVLPRFVNITTSKKKDVTDISKVTKPTKKAPIIRTTKFRFFLTPDQLPDVIKSHNTNKQLHEWVKGDFSFAAPGEQIPTGSLEVSIKVPSGLDFLVFPKVLKVEGERWRRREMAEEVQAAESTSELSECPYVSDVRVEPTEEEGVDKGRPRWKKARSDLLAWLAQTEEGLSFEKEHHV